MDLPKNKEAEHAVVASVLFEPSMFRKAAHLTADHFLETDARELFEEMKERHEEARTWRSDEWPDYFIMHQDKAVYLDAHLDEEIRKVEEAAVCRRGMLLANKLARSAGKLDAEAVEGELARIRLPARGGSGTSAAQVSANLFDWIGEAGSLKLPTGFYGMDQGGLLKHRQATVLAARPSMGKSQLCAQIAYNVAKSGRAVAYWSGEMANEEVMDRIVQAEVGVSTYDAESEDDVRKVGEALGELTTLDNLHLFDEPMTSMDFWGQCRRIADSEDGIDLIVVDHIRLMKDDGDQERHRLGNILSNLKYAAKELDCAALVVAQLSRSPEGRADKRPGLTDLRDSGELEENTDIAAFIYREKYYDRDRDTGDQSGHAQVYLAKHRNGRLWGTTLWFQADRAARFLETRPY